jgi:CRP/FNR family cyclic AMP-dependent transcriptional regulator
MTAPESPERCVLQRFRLLETLGDAERAAFESALRVSEVTRGTRLYEPGDPADRLYLLRSGVVKLWSPGRNSRAQLLAIVYAGDLFGESAVLDEAPRDHVAEAHEDSTVCSVPRDLVLALMRARPEFGVQMARLVAARAQSFKTRVEQLLHRSAEARLAQTLLALGRECGTEVGRGLVIPLRLSQRDLASLVGVRRETVNLVLQAFRQRGLVEAARHHIVLPDPEALSAIR